jgi:hypothetical protein
MTLEIQGTYMKAGSAQTGEYRKMLQTGIIKES